MNTPQADLQAAVKALLLLRSEMTDRENRMHKASQQEMGTLRYEVSQVKREMSTLVNGAGARIVEQARDAVAPTAAQYDRAVQAASSRLQGTGRLVWLWFGTAIGVVLLVLMAGWAVLGYYRREVAQARETMQRYENALPVLQAYQASDAVLCNGRLCVAVDRNAPALGDKGRYRQASARPSR